MSEDNHIERSSLKLFFLRMVCTYTAEVRITSSYSSVSLLLDSTFNFIRGLSYQLIGLAGFSAYHRYDRRHLYYSFQDSSWLVANTKSCIFTFLVLPRFCSHYLFSLSLHCFSFLTFAPTDIISLCRNSRRADITCAQSSATRMGNEEIQKKSDRCTEYVQ